MSALNKQVGGNHYKRMAIQPIEFITKNELLFNEGNIVKYVCRYKNKNGLEDLEKILQYCDFIEEKARLVKHCMHCHLVYSQIKTICLTTNI